VHTLRVLIVDDEPGLRQGTERVLQTYAAEVPGCEGPVQFVVDQAASAEEGLTAIAAAPPDILLLDLRLPGMTGLDMLDEIRDQGLLTIVITGYASLENAIKATKGGAFDILPKPYTPDELIAIVGKAAHHLLVERQAQALQRSQRRVRFNFVSLLAHELKTPLAAVGGYLDILQDRDAAIASGMYDQVVARSQARIESMRKMISDLLDLTRIESGQRNRDVKAVNLREVARACVELCRIEGLEHDLHVATAELAEPLTVQADRAEMEMVLNNLLSNAVKYNRPGGSVTLDLVAEGTGVRITVTDTGIGMTAEEVSGIFHDFVRVKNEQTRNIIGSGLGLAIVRRVVDLYGGTVRVESRPGEGSTFIVWLPDIIAAPAASCSPTPDPTP
jgi:two-component system, sensor histidine kinase and response regulator